jgi:hypothetical protein
LNHFINMAQGIKKGDNTLFDRVLALVKGKKIAIPASGVLLMELLSVKNPDQRKDVGHVVKNLSDRFVIRDFQSVLNMEITNAVAEHYADKRRFPLPYIVFGFGYFEAFGHVTLNFADAKLEAGAKAAMEEVFWNSLESGAALDNLLNGLHFPKYEKGGPEHQQLMDATRVTRDAAAQKSFTKLQREYVQGMIPAVSRYFNDAAKDLGLLINGQIPEMPAKFTSIDFLTSIPTINTWSDLHLYLYHKNLQANVELNDMYDVAHLSVAVPYCDMVVCDKKMKDVLRQSGLDKKYDTVVFANLPEAVEFLERSG